jgi:hypothetical protein
MIESACPRVRRTALILALAGCLFACTTVEKRSFNVKKDAQVASAQIAVGADFSRYDSLLPEDAGIYFPESAPATGEDMRRIRQLFRDAFLAELSSYTITDQPGPRTMAVQPTLIDMRAARGAEVIDMRSDLRELARPGSLVFLMELKDSQTGDVLARAADSAETPAFATAAGTETDWSSVEQAAQRWARLFREFLDRNMAR